MKQSSKRNLTMVMDLYELTMANGYFNDGDKTARVAFDVFYRKNPDRGGFARYKWTYFLDLALKDSRLSV